MTTTAERPTTNNGARALLATRLDESGLSVEKFAADCLIREARTVRRWITGESPVPGKVVDWLVDPWHAPWPAKRRKRRAR